MQARSALAHCLVNNGVHTIFSVIGDGNAAIIDSLVNELAVKNVRAAHEAAATNMADGFARVSGELGVASITHGPGLTNAFTALVEATRSRTPMLVVCGDTALSDRLSLQDIAQREIVRASGAGFEQVRSPTSAAIDASIAVRRAFAEQRPIVLNVPVDFQWVDVPQLQMPPALKVHAPAPTTDALDSAFGVLAAARRPIVLAGRGAVKSNSREALLRLADRLGAPVATTLLAKDYFSGTAHDLGVFGSLSSPSTLDVISASDCVVAFGASLSRHTTIGGSLLSDKTVMQIDLDPRQFSHEVSAGAAVLGDTTLAATALLTQLDEAGVTPTSFSHIATNTEPSHTSGHLEPAPGTLDIGDVVRGLEPLLPADRTIVVDIGRFCGQPITGLRVETPEAFVFPAAFTSIGLAMATAVGASFGRPEHPTVVLSGDGSFMMAGIAEFNSAVRHNVDLIAVIFNDGSYGSEYKKLGDAGIDVELSRFDWPELAPLADALGGTGVAVRTLQDFKLVDDAIRGRTGPVLIDVKLDPRTVPWPV